MVHSSTLRQFTASARFDGDVGSEASGGVDAVQRHKRLRTSKCSHIPREGEEGAAKRRRRRRAMDARDRRTAWYGSGGGDQRPRQRSAAPCHGFAIWKGSPTRYLDRGFGTE